jgi:hypothetical protein
MLMQKNFNKSKMVRQLRFLFYVEMSLQYAGLMNQYKPQSCLSMMEVHPKKVPNLPLLAPEVSHKNVLLYHLRPRQIAFK